MNLHTFYCPRCGMEYLIKTEANLTYICGKDDCREPLKLLKLPYVVYRRRMNEAKK